MRKWKVVALVVATIVGSRVAQAQSYEDLKKEIDALKAENKEFKQALTDERQARERLESEHREQQASASVDSELERFINDVSARKIDGTVVKCVANPVTITGQFSFEWGFTTNRNFGLPASLGCGNILNGSQASALNCLGFPLFFQNPNPPIGPQPQTGGKDGLTLPVNVQVTNSLFNDLKTANFSNLFFFDLIAGAVSAAGLRGDLEGHDDDGTYTQARMRIGFQFDLACDVTAFFEVQSFGSFNNGIAPYPLDGELSQVDLYQGYVEFRNIFGRPEFSSKTGRQEIVLGHEFQFGNNDFYAGESFDGTRLDWNSECWSLTGLALTLRSNTISSGTNHPYGFDYDDDQLYGLYFTYKGVEHFYLDLYWIYQNDHNHFPGSYGTDGGLRGTLLFQGLFNEAYYHTLGARVGGVFPGVCAGLDWNVEGAGQIGGFSNPFPGFPSNLVPDLGGDVTGWTVEAEIGLSLEGSMHFRIYGRALFASGSDQLDETGYIPLFPERHSSMDYRARYGLMDIIPMSNVISGQIGVTFDPDPKWTIGATVLYAVHDEDVFTIKESHGLITIGRDDGIGWEVDAFVEYRYSEQATLGLGLGVFLPNKGAPLAGFFPIDRAVGAGEDDVAFLAYFTTNILF